MPAIEIEELASAVITSVIDNEAPKYLGVAAASGGTGESNGGVSGNDSQSLAHYHAPGSIDEI